MQVRSKSSTSHLLGRRRARGNRDSQHVSGSAGPVEPARELQRSRRQGGQSQDRALYTCSCGFAFDALVSTSVDCPHCGSTQAW
ncbi:MAG TPA: hypothetical protein VMP89_10580 [Solirubrobacteraceae bacterium]|nr:hypothetical protein [Solirubrobacteraceae bacterium]